MRQLCRKAPTVSPSTVQELSAGPSTVSSGVQSNLPGNGSSCAGDSVVGMAPLALDADPLVAINPPQLPKSEPSSDDEERVQIDPRDIARRYEILRNLATSDDDVQAWLDIDDAPGEHHWLYWVLKNFGYMSKKYH